MSSLQSPSRRSPCARSLLGAFLSSLFLLATACAATRAAQEQPPGSVGQEAETAPAADLTEKQAEDLQYHASILQNAANDHVTRAGAAARLLRMELPEADRVLSEALGSGEPSLMLAVIEALGSATEPAPGLLGAAVQALRTAPQETLDQLAIVVARYETAALDDVSALALDRALPIPERLGPIRALASFSTRESVDRLMELADPARGEEPAIREAALESLRRIAPADLGSDYNRWRAWWNQARQSSRVEWAREVVRQYQDRTAELERLNDELVLRYVALLRELYVALPLAGQLQRLPGDLDDALAPVREFALGRIARLLRDSVPIPEPVRAMVLSRLDDEVPALRRQAAQLLDELDEPTLAERIAQRLGAEHDREVILAYLQLLKNRTTSAALEPILAWLGDEQLGDPAAEALWKLLRTTGVSAEQSAPARQAVTEALSVRPSSSRIIRLAAYLCEEADLQQIQEMLAGDDAAIRAAVAEGLCARGQQEALLEHAADPAVYPWALRVLADGPADLAAFQLLTGLRPTAEMAPTWAEAVRVLAARLDPALVLEADDALARTDYANARLRATVLRRVAALPPEALTLEYRIRLLSICSTAWTARPARPRSPN
jgi:HEAT repeat protein